MIQIPLETFSYSNQSDEVSVGPELVRCSKWNRRVPIETCHVMIILYLSPRILGTVSISSLPSLSALSVGQFSRRSDTEQRSLVGVYVWVN